MEKNTCSVSVTQNSPVERRELELFPVPRHQSILKSPETGLTIPCSSCGAIEVVFKPSESTHYGSWNCSQCGAFRGWVRKPENVARIEEENQLIDKLLERFDGLTSWERLFLKSVKETKKRSPKQREKLNLIASRLGVSHHE